MTPTPHNSAVLGDIADTVLMPGDPLRAKLIAETFLENPVQYNTVRGMLGFTGTYKGKRISVQGSGMGVPSMGIYSYELFAFYGVERIIRVGTAASLDADLKIKDIVLAMGACTNSNFMSQYQLNGTFAPIASYPLLKRAAEECEAKQVNYKVGNVLTSDAFYSEDTGAGERWRSMGVLAIEMETAGLYANAARLGKQALCILTISDHALTGEETTAEERQTAFTDMMEIALNASL